MCVYTCIYIYTHTYSIIYNIQHCLSHIYLYDIFNIHTYVHYIIYTFIIIHILYNTTIKYIQIYCIIIYLYTTCIYCEVCLESIHHCNMENRDIYWRRYKIQETLYIGQWHLSPLQSRHVGFTQFSQLPLAALLYFPESHWRSEISFLPKVILVLGKARRCRAPNMSCRGAESPDALPKNSAWHDVWADACSDAAANHQLPIAAAFWITQ